ncbi:MAG: GNAT family N-acetyltransferase [Nitrospiraceae bacterium]
MQPDDRSAVIEILAGSDPWKRLGYTAADWDRLFTPLPQGRDGFVIQFNEKVAGLALIRRKFLMGDYLELFAIAGWARGKGLGGTLLEHLETVVFERCRNFFVCVSDFNEGARKFYKKQGYQEIGPMPDFLIPGAAEILLRKTAGPARGK